MARLPKVKLPEASAVVEALEWPLSDTVSPPVPEIVPEMLKVCAVAVKFTPVTLALLMVTLWLEGVKV